ncbi:hypothetical protein VDG1235_3883 [Verrucomicrobiia bacterium DG1235]|nr:hypothetical protein VDG1235_3883 [Verrucomicrobiae bacterium DG1235]
MNKLKKKIFSMLSASLCAIQAHAILVDRGDYTRDTDTGLDWLDMSFTDGLSYNAVGALLLPGGSLQGWRFATSAEFDGLINSAVGPALAPYTPTGFDPAIFSQMQTLVSLLGETLNLSPTLSTIGYVDSSSFTFADARQFSHTASQGFVRPASELDWDRPKSTENDVTGSFLVRKSASSVPDAGSTAVLLSIAISGLFILKRRK